jgi:hypothetical protein
LSTSTASMVSGSCTLRKTAALISMLCPQEKLETRQSVARGYAAGEVCRGVARRERHQATGRSHTIVLPK